MLYANFYHVLLPYYVVVVVAVVGILDGEHEFLDLSDKLSKLAKYAPHLWKDDVSW